MEIRGRPIRHRMHDDDMTLQDDLETLAEASDFSGAILVARGAERLVELVRGDADRAERRPSRLETRFGIASVTKGFTALTVASLVDSGALAFDTPLRSVLGDALPTVDAAVTIEHLLGHTSGIGDYLDEETLGDIDDYVMPVPVHRLASPGDYLPILDGYPQQSAPGGRFAYNNGGYVLLSIAAELATGRSFYDVVQERVLDRAGMVATGFFRSDRVPAGAAIGYLADGRSNVLHLPVRGAGDGGASSTVDDLVALWDALFAGRIVPLPMVERLVEARSDVPSERRRYGLGFWLGQDDDTVMLEGMDAGISCRTACHRPSGVAYAAVSNTSSGVWRLARFLDERLPELGA
jgi:CubicO group peptidase (beta-lactamase class C family)